MNSSLEDLIGPYLTSSHRPLKFRENAICQLLYEDKGLLVIDKKAGFLTHPTDKEEPKTVRGALNRYMVSRYKRRGSVIAAHRLDRGTSGILVFAKDERTAEHLINQFKDRKPKRTYLALVAGTLKDDKGTLESYLFTDSFLNQKSTDDPTRGKIAITHYEVLARIHGATLIKVNLETGRRNQIRVHFSDLGHPVLGDTRYLSEAAEHKRWNYKRLALHAASLAFDHPVTRRELNFSSALPVEFLRFCGLAVQSNQLVKTGISHSKL